MNILMINLDKAVFYKNSANRKRLEEYSNSLDSLFVIVWTLKKEEPIIINDKLYIYPTNSFFKLLYFWDTLRIAKKLLRKHKIDLIVSQDSFETGLAGWLVAKKNKIALQTQVHTDFLSPYFWKQSFSNKIRVLLAKFLLNRSNGIRVASQRIKKSLLASGYLLKSIIVLPIFVDIEKFKSAPIKINFKQKYQQFDFIILLASRLSREKNIVLAIETMTEIIKKYPKTGMIIVGSGMEKENLELIIKNLNLSGNIIMEAWNNDLASYYKSADLFLLTSNYEGWGMTVIEAMACGCPVVMTDVGCAGEVVEDGKSGIIIPVGNKNKLIEAISKIIEDDDLRKKLSENAKLVTEKMPNKEQVLQSYKKSWEVAVINKL